MWRDLGGCHHEEHAQACDVVIPSGVTPGMPRCARNEMGMEESDESDSVRIWVVAVPTTEVVG